ncbi:MAG TPA: serine hydrolase [Candidatus Eremiobacteraceae bacterium]|nr:serine hydrolase [Candidatus Eremiobacteraceae bacterium]
MTFAALAVAAAITAAQSHAIDGLVKKTLASEHIAGATVAVSVRGKIAFESGYGFADIGSKKRAAIDTAYPIGSITKQFTAACILLLAQDKKLSLDDPISQYVPGLPWGERVTLRHLLDQESGVVDFRLGSIDTSSRLSHDEVVARLAKTDLLFPPGSRYEYSNSNYYLLGLVVEKVSGQTYPAFLDSRVLKRVGLAATFYNDGTRTDAPLASGYTATSNGPQPVAAESADWGYAAGSIASTVADLASWDDALRVPGLLDAGSLREMFTAGILDSGAATDYAFGWVAVRHNGRRLFWHNGEVAGFHAMNAAFPDDRTDVIVLTNTGNTFAADRLALQIFDVVHPFAPSSADLAAVNRAREWIGRISRGDIDRTQLTDQMSAVMTDDIVRSAGAQLRALGVLKSIKETGVDEDASGRSYGFDATFAKRGIHLIMGIDASGKISALSIGL